MRAIAREAGVTEAVVYRHFSDKQALLDEVHSEIIEEMIAQKQRLLRTPGTACEKVREWVRLSYESFDRDPHGFTTVFLHAPNDERGRKDRRQSELFFEVLRRASKSEQEATLATAMFVSMLLTVPRLINAGEAEGPAGKHASRVGEAACRMLGLA